MTRQRLLLAGEPMERPELRVGNVKNRRFRLPAFTAHRTQVLSGRRIQLFVAAYASTQPDHSAQPPKPHSHHGLNQAPPPYPRTMSDISQAIFGLVGVVVGGGITTTATIWAQRAQMKAAIAAEAREREIAASSAAMDALSRLLYLESSAKADASTRPVHPDSNNTRRQLLLQVATATHDMRQADLRVRIDQALRILTHHTAAWNMIGQPESQSRQIACTHTIECIGAFRRGEPLPPRPTAFDQTIKAIEQWSSTAGAGATKSSAGRGQEVE
jgi:hypothetical protein